MQKEKQILFLSRNKTFIKIKRVCVSMKGMIKKEGEKTCLQCSNKISLAKDNFVLIGTYNRVSSPDDEQFFHFTCFVEWYNQRVQEKVRNQVKFMQQKALQVFNNPTIQGVLSKIAGSEQLASMLNINLDVPTKVNYIKRVKKVTAEEVAQKIQDDRARKNKKRKSK